MSDVRPPVVELCQPWFNDPYPELWITGRELVLMLGLGKDNINRHAEINVYCERFGIRVWYSELRPKGRARRFYRMNLSDLDAIRIIRKRREQDGVRPNPIEEYLSRFKSVTPFSIP